MESNQYYNIDKYNGLTKEDIKKYSFLIDVDVTDLKETLQDLTLNYYKYYINNDAVNFERTAKELNNFISLNISAINNYINFCYVLASYQILNKLYDCNFDFYAPGDVSLNIKSYKERQAENYIKHLGLNIDEVNEIIEYNKKNLDLEALHELEANFNENEKTKYIKMDTINIDNIVMLLNSGYTGDFDIKQDMKLFIRMDLMFLNYYGVLIEMAKEVNKPLFDFINKSDFFK